jgi:uncharacterized low-complexity protein
LPTPLTIRLPPSNCRPVINWRADKKTDGKCGEAKCGADKKDAADKKAAGDKKSDGKCGADKKGDASCGAKK